MDEKRREYYKKYYQKHKKEILERNKRWRDNNKDKFRELLHKNRKEKAIKLKEKGLKYVWASNIERERLYTKYYERINKRNKENENKTDDKQQE